MVRGRPVAFVSTPAEGVPMFGVTSVGEVSTTNFVPVPVCEAIDVALPTDVIGPVRFAFVVTVPAVSPEAVPVKFVATPEAGVPSAGVTRVGEVANTTSPLPVVVAAEIAVPLPWRMPVMEVEIVMAGVLVAVATVPAKPFAGTTETLLTVPEPLPHEDPVEVKFPDPSAWIHPESAPESRMLAKEPFPATRIFPLSNMLKESVMAVEGEPAYPIPKTELDPD